MSLTRRMVLLRQSDSGIMSYPNRARDFGDGYAEKTEFMTEVAEADEKMGIAYKDQHGSRVRLPIL